MAPILYRQLAEICRQNLFREKILIFPTLSSGFSFLQGYALAGYRGFNLKNATLDSLLEEEYLSGDEALHLFYPLLKDLARSRNLRYFSRLEITRGMARALLSALTEMKMAGLAPEDVNPQSFLNPEKAEDLLLLWREYDDALIREGLLDRPTLWDRGTGSLSHLPAPLYIIPSNLKLSRREEDFLRPLAGPQNLEFLFLPEPLGLENPRGKGLAPPIPPHLQTEGNLFTGLYGEGPPSPLPPKPKTQIFHAYGEGNEIREILRRIRDRGFPLDQCAIYYTSSEPYLQYLYHASQLHRLPVTFGEGLGILTTRPGRFLNLILAWVEENYDVCRLHELLSGPDLEFKGPQAPSPEEAAARLRSLGIGWGRERYLTCLDRALKGAKDPQDTAVLIYLKDFFQEIFALIPKPDSRGLVNPGDFFQGFRRLVAGFCSTPEDLDREGQERILDCLDRLPRFVREPLPLKEALLVMEKALEGNRVGRSGPRPGCLHVDSYRRGPFALRPVVFIAGLDALRFPGGAGEDPILLDVERERLSPHLALQRFRSRENLYRMVQFLSLLKGEVTMSYSSFDTIEHREMFPSPLLLQVHRMLEGDPKKDYSSLARALGDRKTFTPAGTGAALDEQEWWLAQAAAGGLKGRKDALLSVYDGLLRGEAAHRSRSSGSFTVYTGKIPSMKWKYRFLSASQLENLAACPFGYFLRYILRISPPEGPAADPGAWLDPAARGTLLHAIFEEFYKAITDGQEKPSFQKHLGLLMTIARARLKKAVEEYPPPNPVALQHETGEILESCRVFLKSEEELADESSPAFFELSFGLGGGGGPPPVRIDLPSGKHFYLRGIVDRVDMLDDTRALVLDYKTGSTYGFDLYRYYKGGRQLQHTLYAVALEKVFQQEGRSITVAQAGYSFPTVKGEGQRVLRDQRDRSSFFRILEDLIEILEQGAFTLTEDGGEAGKSGDCRYCDYPAVCRGRRYPEALARMLEDPGQKELEPFRRLRKYD